MTSIQPTSRWFVCSILCTSVGAARHLASRVKTASRRPGVTLAGLLVLSGCALATVERPLDIQGEARPAPYAQEVYADEPLAHWRLSGSAPGAIQSDADGALRLKEGEQKTLEGADMGGPEAAFEVWVKDARGTALSYSGPDGAEAFAIEITDTLAVRLLGERHDTGLRLDEGRWQHVGVSWRSEDGALMVAVDGFSQLETRTSRGRQLPYDGKLVLGAEFRGELDEVVVFDKAQHASRWLHRCHVAQAKASPSLPDEQLPVRLVLQSGHTDAVQSVSWSPDGARLATTSLDDTVKVWDSRTGALLHDLRSVKLVFLGPNGGQLAWNPDGTRFATAGDDGMAKVWDSHTGALLHELQAHTSAVLSVGWSPDGTKLATTGDDNVAKVWDGHTGALLHEFAVGARGHAVDVSLAWSPDGTRLAIAGEDNVAKIWDGHTGALLHELQVGVREHATDVSWSPDGTLLATVSKDDKVAVWDSRTGALIDDTFPLLEPRLISWSPDGARLAVVGPLGYADIVVVWDSDTRLVHTRRGGGGEFDHQSKYNTINTNKPMLIASMSWSPDGTRLVITDSDHEVTLWSSDSGELLHRLKGLADKVLSVEWSPDGSRLATAGEDGTAKVWGGDSGALLLDLKAQAHEVTSAGWSPDGARLAMASRDHTAKVWDSHTGAVLNLTGHSGVVRGVAWSPDGGRVATAGGDGSVKLWSSQTGAMELDVKVHRHPRDNLSVRLVEWSPDGARLATAHTIQDGEMILPAGVATWDSRTGAPLQKFEAGDALSVSWSPDGAQLATGGSSTAEVWDSRTGALLHAFKEQGLDVTSVSWSPDGAKLATASEGLRQSAIKVWDVASGALLIDLHEPYREEDVLARLNSETQSKLNSAERRFATSVAWSPDGTRLATVDWSHTVKVRDGQTGALLFEGEDHTDIVNSVNWSPDGAKLVTASDDNTVKVWDIQRGTRVTFISTRSGQWLTFNDRGYFDGSALASSLLAVAQGSRVFSFEQLAPTRNRPDKVLEALGAPRALIGFNETLWRRRLKRLGLSPGDVSDDFSSAPAARILHVQKPEATGVAVASLLFKDRVGLKGYRLFVNGVPLSQELQPLQGARRRLSVPIQLTAGTNQIEVAAINAQGVESLRGTTTVEHDGEGLPAPKLYFVGFGVSDYADDRMDLRFAHQDVLDLEAALLANKGGFAEVRTTTFTDAQVVEGSLGRARAFLDGVSEHDTLVMFVAGHGVRGQDEARTYYYIDHDTDLSDLEGTAIPFEQLEELLYGSRARKKLFLLDTCESGEDIDITTLTADPEGARGQKARTVRGFKVPGAASKVGDEPGDDVVQMWLQALRDKDRLIMQDLTRRSGAVVLASSLGQESSLEAPAWSNGAFTEELLRALQSDVADTNRDGEVSVGELVRHVTAAVPKLTGGRQHPNVEQDNALQHFALRSSYTQELTFDIKEMVHVPAGEFVMGEGDSQRKVHLDEFWIDTYEVTVSQYAQCVRAGMCAVPSDTGPLHNWSAPEKRDHPVNGVGWEQAAAYCAWKGKRLPTEAEWEKTARGAHGWTYPWGEGQPSCARAVIFSDGSLYDRCGEPGTQAVGSKPDGVSPYGAHDMAGNVCEWVSDWYGEAQTATRNPTGPRSGSYHVSRGGSWLSRGRDLQGAHRSGCDKDACVKFNDPLACMDSDQDMGFRCAGSAEPR